MCKKDIIYACNYVDDSMWAIFELDNSKNSLNILTDFKLISNLSHFNFFFLLFKRNLF